MWWRIDIGGSDPAAWDIPEPALESDADAAASNAALSPRENQDFVKYVARTVGARYYRAFETPTDAAATVARSSARYLLIDLGNYVEVANPDQGGEQRRKEPAVSLSADRDQTAFDFGEQKRVRSSTRQAARKSDAPSAGDSGGAARKRSRG